MDLYQNYYFLVVIFKLLPKRQAIDVKAVQTIEFDE